MSYIFDALQKAESAHCRKGENDVVGILELLSETECRAAARWGSGGEGEQAAGDGLKPSSAALPVNHQARRLAAVSAAEVEAVPTSRLVALSDSQGAAAEAFRVLSVRLRQLQRDAAIKSVLISSASPQEGKSLVAGNLACTLAFQSRQRVLLLEGDCRRPTLCELFGMNRIAGLNEYYRQGKGLAECIHHLGCAGIWFLPAGQPAEDTPSLLQLSTGQALMERLSEWFDWIIVDSPPMLPLADASVWMRIADAILLVVRQGLTERRQLNKVLETLEQKKLVGAVLNCSSNPAHNDYYYGSSRTLSIS